MLTSTINIRGFIIWINYQERTSSRQCCGVGLIITYMSMSSVLTIILSIMHGQHAMIRAKGKNFQYHYDLQKTTSIAAINLDRKYWYVFTFCNRKSLKHKRSTALSFRLWIWIHYEKFGKATDLNTTCIVTRALNILLKKELNHLPKDTTNSEVNCKLYALYCQAIRKNLQCQLMRCSI